MGPPVSTGAMSNRYVPEGIFATSAGLLGKPFTSFSGSSSLLYVPLVCPTVMSFPTSPTATTMSSPVF